MRFARSAFDRNLPLFPNPPITKNAGPPHKASTFDFFCVTSVIGSSKVRFSSFSS